jgi:hypothetical protein
MIIGGTHRKGPDVFEVVVPCPVMLKGGKETRYEPTHYWDARELERLGPNDAEKKPLNTIAFRGNRIVAGCLKPTQTFLKQIIIIKTLACIIDFNEVGLPLAVFSTGDMRLDLPTKTPSDPMVLIFKAFEDD